MGFLQFSSLSSYPMASRCSSCSWTRLAWSSCIYQKKHIKQRPREMVGCREPAWGTPPVAKVMRKEARHTQRRDRASGVPLEILEHLPPKPESAYFTALCSHLHLWLYGALSPTTSFWKRVNLQLQLIKFLGVTRVFQPTNSFGSPLACLNRFFQPHEIVHNLPTMRSMRCSKLSKYRFLWAVKID